MTELALREETTTAVALTSDIDSWAQIAGSVIKLANEIYDTPFIPDGLRGSAAGVAAAILAGREMGIGPMTALQQIHIIKNKPAQSALLMRALILKQGHDWQDVKVSDDEVIVKARRKGERDWTEASFTRAQAAKARIDLGGYPQDKLYARATSRLARRKFADVIAGMPYSAEELEDEPGDVAAIEAPKPGGRVTAAEIIGQQAPQTASPAATAPRAPETQPAPPAERAAGEAPTPPLPGEDEPDDTAPSERHHKLVGAIQGHMKRLEFAVDDSDRFARLPILAMLAGVRYDDEAIFSTGDFDDDELSTIADTLSRCKDRETLNALLESRAPDA